MEPPGEPTARAALSAVWVPRVTEVSPAARDVALGLCLGVEELQHHPSALWGLGWGLAQGAGLRQGGQQEGSTSS